MFHFLFKMKTKLNGGCTYCLIDVISQLFYHLGWTVGRKPLLFVVASVISAIILTSGNYFVTIHNDLIFGYTPDDAASHREHALYREYFEIERGPYGMVVFIEARDGGSLLRKEHLDAVYNFTIFIQRKFTVSTPEVNNYTFSMSCEPRCDINMPVELFKVGIDHQRALIEASKPRSIAYELSYPTANYLNAIVDMANNFHQVTINKSFINITGTEVESASLINLYLAADQGNTTMQKVLNKWELELFDYCLHMNDPYIKALVYGNYIANKEGMRAGMGIFPYFAGGWTLMLIFVFVVIVLNAMYYSKMGSTKIIVVLAAWFTPILAVGATFGLVSILGQSVNALMGVIPLLVVAIGVDDAFLMLHSWQRCTSDHSIAEKTALVFYEIVPSVAITSITNSLAFAVGAFAPMPDIRRFCLVTSIAMAMDFIFQLTLFGPVLSWSGHRETDVSEPKWKNLDQSLQIFLNAYCKYITSWKAKIPMILFLITSLTASIFGIIQMKADFQPAKSFTSDSPLLNAVILDEVIHKEHHTVMFFVNKPPNLSNAAEYRGFEEMVNRLETLPNALSNLTLLWLTHYVEWSIGARNSLDWLTGEKEIVLTYDDVPYFMETPVSQTFRKTVKYQYSEYEFVFVTFSRTFEYFRSEDQIQVESFYFAVFYGNLSNFIDRVDVAKRCRQVLEQYHEFNTSFYEYESSLYDLSLAVKGTTFRAIVVTMTCMAIVCLLFIPNICCVLVATFAIGSICVDTLGMLGWWHVDMDPLAMINMIMSVGFNVDYTAHIIYHYHSKIAKGLSKETRLLAALHSVAVPMIQAGLSTLVCIGLLAFNDVYLFNVFFKTILLVVCNGLIHGLFVVPTILTWLPDCMIGHHRIKKDKSLKDEYSIKEIENTESLLE